MKDASTMKSSQIVPLAMTNLRTIRQSQPNFFPHDIFKALNKIQHEQQFRLNKNSRQARHSELKNSQIIGFFSPDLKLNEFNKPSFLSPPHGLESKTMVKSQKTICNNLDLLSSKNTQKKMGNGNVVKNRKSSPRKNHLGSLQMIEEMLMNHGVAIQGTKGNGKEKAPRFSQPMLIENEGLGKKQNESLGNMGKKEEDQKKQLKQTISTSASCKNIRHMRISDFDFGKDLGKGKFGKVRLARHKKTGLIFSLKTIKKSSIREENLIDQMVLEIKIQKFLNHRHIIKLYSVFDDRENIYLLMELCTDGNVYSLMRKKEKISEVETGALLKEVCEGVNYLHQNSIIHRDIKPQNIVMCYGMSKICDFGWATITKSMRDTFCGTPLYVSPQLLNGDLYDEKVDLWAIGILGYEMMTGSIPFRIKSEKDLSKIIHKQITFPTWLSSSAVSFLQHLLERDPKKRKDITDILVHQFLNARKTP